MYVCALCVYGCCTGMNVMYVLGVWIFCYVGTLCIKSLYVCDAFMKCMLCAYMLCVCCCVCMRGYECKLCTLSMLCTYVKYVRILYVCDVSVYDMYECMLCM